MLPLFYFLIISSIIFFFIVVPIALYFYLKNRKIQQGQQCVQQLKDAQQRIQQLEQERAILFTWLDEYYPAWRQSFKHEQID